MPARSTLLSGAASFALLPASAEGGLPARAADRVWTTRGPRAALALEGVAQPVEVDLSGEGGPAPGEAVRLRVARLSLFH